MRIIGTASDRGLEDYPTRGPRCHPAGTVRGPGAPRRPAPVVCCPDQAGPGAGALLPDPREVDDDLDRLLHVLDRDPLEPRVEVVLAGEDVRRRQAHEGEPRAVGAAADRRLAQLEAGAPDRLARVLDHLRVLVEHFLHVAVGLLDLAGRPRRPASRRPSSCASCSRKSSFSLSSAVTKSRIRNLTEVFSTAASTTYGWTKPSRRSVVSGESRSLGRREMKSAGDLDRVDHPPLGEAGVRVEALEGDGHRVGREGLHLDLAQRLAVHRVGAEGAELLHVEVLRAAARPPRPA